MNITINRPAMPATGVTLELTVEELRRLVRSQREWLNGHGSTGFSSGGVTSAARPASRPGSRSPTSPAGEPRDMIRFRMTRARWEQVRVERAFPDVAIDGLGPCLPLLGVG